MFGTLKFVLITLKRIFLEPSLMGNFYGCLRSITSDDQGPWACFDQGTLVSAKRKKCDNFIIKGVYSDRLPKAIDKFRWKTLQEVATATTHIHTLYQSKSNQKLIQILPAPAPAGVLVHPQAGGHFLTLRARSRLEVIKVAVLLLPARHNHCRWPPILTKIKKKNFSI